MIHMRNVGRHHVLMLDINTDKSHVMERKTDKVVMIFDSSAYGFDEKGEQICHLTTNHKSEWVVDNELGIETTPVCMKRHVDGIYDVEAEFALKWLEQQQVGVI